MANGVRRMEKEFGGWRKLEGDSKKDTNGGRTVGLYSVERNRNPKEGAEEAESELVSKREEMRKGGDRNR